MKNIFKITLLLIISIFFSACSDKHLNIKSLQPSKLEDNKIHNIILEEFENDNVNQANNIEMTLVNKVVNGIRVFELKPTYKNIDAIVTGKVLDSSLYYDFYYDEETDYSHCVSYEYKDGKRTSNCLRYKKIRIPCEKKKYRLKTQVQVLDKNEKILFSKIYSKTDFEDECHRYGYFHSPFFYTNYQKEKDKYRVNSKLSLEIAKELANDISPHFTYEKIEIITELKKEYKESIQKDFENIIQLLIDKSINLAQKRLDELNKKTNYKSAEIYYNLALTYESQGDLNKARFLYNISKKLSEDTEDLKLIDKALTRVDKNIYNRKKALYQLN